MEKWRLLANWRISVQRSIGGLRSCRLSREGRIPELSSVGKHARMLPPGCRPGRELLKTCNAKKREEIRPIHDAGWCFSDLSLEAILVDLQ
jgi:hypothetical protein